MISEQTSLKLQQQPFFPLHHYTHEHAAIDSCGVTQVQALRSVEKYLQLEKLYVLGTNCVDNGPPEGLGKFLKAASSSPETVLHYEFMQVCTCTPIAGQKSPVSCAAHLLPFCHCMLQAPAFACSVTYFQGICTLLIMTQQPVTVWFTVHMSCQDLTH